ncbi:MAG: glutamine amidotransferase [Anaerolineae bacterium]|nr:glutamine amidotransferase [Anaerolineae bacterium]
MLPDALTRSDPTLGRKLVIIKLGATFPYLAAKHGDFEDWILGRMGLRRQDAPVIDPTAGQMLPPLDAIAGAVITGSHAMVTDRATWSERTAAWLREAVDFGLPVLGICYGHQLLAYALGGIVEDNPRGWEFGTVTTTLTTSAQADPLLGGLGEAIEVQTSHTQSVTRLPSGARLFACSEKDPHLAYGIGDRVWGVQFHPEFDACVVRAYVEATRAGLVAQGQDPDAILRGVRETPSGHRILRRFARLVLAPQGRPLAEDRAGRDRQPILATRGKHA